MGIVRSSINTEKQELTIVLSLHKPILSKSRKTKLVAGSAGVVALPQKVDGKAIQITASCFIEK